MRMLILMAVVAMLSPVPIQAGKNDATIIVDHPSVSGRIEAPATTIYPNTSRVVQVVLTPRQRLWALVVQVHIKNVVAIDPNDDGACAYSITDEAVCTWLGIDAGQTVTRTITMNPIHIVTTPISQACTTDLFIGTPVSLSANGEEIVYRQVLWSPYRAGYCTYFPSLSGSP